MRELVYNVGHGPLEAVCNVDQVYAKYQEVHETFRHPHGGQARALETTVFSVYDEAYQLMADEVLEGRVRQAAIWAAERMTDKYFDLAPVELTNLRSSGHPTAIDDGATYYDRPPLQHRLSEEELRALDAQRNAINPHHWYGSPVMTAGM